MRAVTYTCPGCTYPHSGPWVTCHLCGFSKLQRHQQSDLYAISESIQDITAELKADNDRAEAKVSNT